MAGIDFFLLAFSVLYKAAKFCHFTNRFHEHRLLDDQLEQRRWALFHMRRNHCASRAVLTGLWHTFVGYVAVN
jgi:hypothetical protein